jgi:hypothetical protein
MTSYRVATGTKMLDCSYRYACASCAGTGKRGEQICQDCYGLDIERITLALKTARGYRYYALLKAWLSVRGKEMADEAKRVKEKGALSPIDVGYISLRFDLNLKATSKWLGECRVIPAGAYEYFMHGHTVHEVYAAAREKYPELVEVRA